LANDGQAISYARPRAGGRRVVSAGGDRSVQRTRTRPELPNLPTIDLMNFPLGPGEALDVIARRDLFDAAGAWRAHDPVLTGQGQPRHLSAVRTLGSFFDVFGVVPIDLVDALRSN